ncbi:MAG: hypothetical protein LBQ68_02530 [Clostridiales bacterium]|jgi:hypothetical protein|nr:hypothetical protein [Clostridiales bacterium]
MELKNNITIDEGMDTNWKKEVGEGIALEGKTEPEAPTGQRDISLRERLLPEGGLFSSVIDAHYPIVLLITEVIWVCGLIIMIAGLTKASAKLEYFVGWFFANILCFFIDLGLIVGLFVISRKKDQRLMIGVHVMDKIKHVCWIAPLFIMSIMILADRFLINYVFVVALVFLGLFWLAFCNAAWWFGRSDALRESQLQTSMFIWSTLALWAVNILITLITVIV